MQPILLLLLLLVASGQACENVYPYELDVGIYWAKVSGTGDVTWDKSCPETETETETISPHFQRHLPTMIFTHGLQPEFVKDGERVWLRDEDSGVEFAAFPLKMGWNVGFFQWTQLADEELMYFERAEAKIWSANYYVDMMYTYKDRHGGTVRVADASHAHSVAGLFARHYAMHAALLYDGLEIRVIGHSLGTQVAINGAHLIAEDASIARKPTRIALLDPVYSPDAKGYFLHNSCGSAIGDVMGCYARGLVDSGIAIEYYKASFINRCIFSSQVDTDLVKQSAFSQVVVNKWGDLPMGKCYHDNLFSSPGKIDKRIHALSFQMSNQHVGIVPWYFLSFAMPPHRCAGHDAAAGTCQPLASLALSAAMPTSDVHMWGPQGGMGDRCFNQFDDGQRSETAATMTLPPGDDLFFVHNCDHVNS
jgi:hypothetical protein